MPNLQNTTSTKTESIVLGMGCFWGAEKCLSAVNGVINVESGYAGGDNKNTSYSQLLELEKLIKTSKSNLINHAEVIKVTFNPDLINLETILIKFWENHDPTQGNRQGNDIGTNYRSAIYTLNTDQTAIAEYTKSQFQNALDQADKGKITTKIATLKNYNIAEDYHQNYLQKNPNGYCGLGGTGVTYPKPVAEPTNITLKHSDLNLEKQLIVFEVKNCSLCKKFKQEIMNDWKAEIPIIATSNHNLPKEWTLKQQLCSTPTIILFEHGKEVSRYHANNENKNRFWQWLGSIILNPEQQKIAFKKGTEPAFTGSHLDEKRSGYFIDPITGQHLFRSETKFNSGTGWPSFFSPVEGAVTEHTDSSHSMKRVEVRSATSGIHLGHVFSDGPAPTFKRYCINSSVLKFVPD